MKFFNFHAQFVLPEDFQGGYKDALRKLLEYVDSCDNNEAKLAMPVWVEDAEAFPWTVENGGRLYATFSIEDSAYSDLLEALEDAETE